jgi:uncharacterized protein (TIGR02597 family)
MRKKFFILLASGLTVGQGLACAGTSVSVTSLPQGMVTLATPNSSTTYLSLPLSSNVIYSGTVGSVGPNTITVTSSTTPFKISLASVGSPYFVKMLSGKEEGRLLLITANTTTTLTVDTSDDSSQTVGLETSGFNVAADDSFEVFAGDTLASTFGANTSQNPLTVTGATSFAAADWINVFSPATGTWISYYFNTTDNYWVEEGSTTNANTTVLYPYHGLSITRHSASEPSSSLILTGRVAEVPVMTKTTGNNTIVYGSTGYAVPMKLSQINFGPNWTTGSTTATADVVSVWNSSTKTFISYYELATGGWRQSGLPTVDQGSVIIPPGSCIGIQQHLAVSGATSYLPSSMPYTLPTN